MLPPALLPQLALSAAVAPCPPPPLLPLPLLLLWRPLETMHCSGFASGACPLPQALYKPFTRLPSRLLYDTSVDGPLLRT